ncbi:hypothetical protein [Porphyromonas levii]|uniref:hypothetical protein n=1 Tax=Porphyromonas levii TaxID=28114 RepID=UPI001B8CD7A5|nr:hypothetical protein [Porphyromonas levii]MBR8758668.1 hypothetical protein [Porphyromonas levii]MBR8762838.1 hypothetical protein [Porphyromonas levii]
MKKSILFLMTSAMLAIGLLSCNGDKPVGSSLTGTSWQHIEREKGADGKLVCIITWTLTFNTNDAVTEVIDYKYVMDTTKSYKDEAQYEYHYKDFQGALVYKDEKAPFVVSKDFSVLTVTPEDEGPLAFTRLLL